MDGISIKQTADRRRQSVGKGFSMRTLDKLFSRYGQPSDEMNETLRFYYIRADHVKSLDKVKYYDKKAEEDIQGLLNFAEILKEYRRTLYDRAQEFLTAGYAMQLKITRNIDCWKGNKKFYVIEVLKIIDLPNSEPVKIFEETYEGKERHTALKRFEQLKKLYPNIETITDIEKKSWEK